MGARLLVYWKNNLEINLDEKFREWNSSGAWTSIFKIEVSSLLRLAHLFCIHKWLTPWIKRNSICPFLNVTVSAAVSKGAVLWRVSTCFRLYRPQHLHCIFFSNFPLKMETFSTQGSSRLSPWATICHSLLQGALWQGTWALDCAKSKAVWALEP